MIGQRIKQRSASIKEEMRGGGRAFPAAARRRASPQWLNQDWTSKEQGIYSLAK